MRQRMRHAAACGLLWMVSCVCCTAHAQDSAPTTSAPERASVLALSVGPDIVDREALRRALEAELGVAVQDAGSAPAYMPTLSVVQLANGNVEVALSSRTVPRSTREFALTAELPAERVEMVALIASNLVRNEAAALLPELAPAPPVAALPRAEPPKPRLVSPCDVKEPAEFGIDLAPGVGASSTRRGRNATRRLSLGLVGTMSGRLHGLEFSFGSNIVKKSVCGMQISTGANISAGPLVGAQFANFNLTEGSLTGAQLGIANLAIDDIVGAQLGVANLAEGSITGAQLGVANYQGGRFTGAQLGVANLAGHGVEGVQGSVLNLSIGAVTGAQLGVVNFARGELRGLQYGVGNLAVGGVRGAQLGVVNISPRDVHGAQVGLFNYARRSDASVGLLSIVRNGRTSIELTGSPETSLVFASVTHGGKYVHNILGIGLRANPGDQRLASMYGIGVRALSRGRVRLDVDAVIQHLYTENMDRKGSTLVTGVRIPVTVMLVRGLGVMVAPSYQVSIIDGDETREVANFATTEIDSGDPRVRGFPGVTLGLRYEFVHGL